MAWDDSEVEILVRTLGTHTALYNTGVKQKFYQLACDLLPNKNIQQVKTKTTDLLSKYRSWKVKLNASGYGVGALDECDSDTFSSISEMLQSKFPQFGALDDIFGSRANVNPLVIAQSAPPDSTDSVMERVVAGQQDESPAAAPRATPTKRTANGDAQVTPAKKSKRGLDIGELLLKKIELGAQRQDAKLELMRDELEFKRTESQRQFDLEKMRLETQLRIEEIALEKKRMELAISGQQK